MLSTREIAEKKKAKVFEISTNDFSEIRNFALSKASGEWVLYLDADERVDKKLQQAIKETIEENSFSAYRLLRKNFYFGKNEWPYVEKLERLFRKEKLRGWEGRLHESPKIEGPVGVIKNGFIEHFTHRDLSSMLNKTIEWSDTESVLRFNASHPKMTWWRFPRVMLTAFLNSYIRQGGYKAGTAGLVESIYQSFSMFVTYAKLWELQQNKMKDVRPKDL